MKALMEMSAHVPTPTPTPIPILACLLRPEAKIGGALFSAVLEPVLLLDTVDDDDDELGLVMKPSGVDDGLAVLLEPAPLVVGIALLLPRVWRVLLLEIVTEPVCRELLGKFGAVEG
jgi:hypothetical protein